MGGFAKRRQRRGAAVVFPLLLFLLGAAGDGDEQNSFYRSQVEADSDLSTFDHDNPECELWTNWQQMCSRLGEGGATACVLDPTFKAKPSRPFCVADRQGYRINRVPISGAASRASANRFCDKREDFGRGAGSECTVHSSRRPFAGTTLASRRSPACEVWADQSSRKAICSESGKFPELPLCKSLPQRQSVSKAKLYCASRSSDLPKLSCSYLDGRGQGPDYPGSGEYEVTGPGYPRFEPAVQGLFCRRH